jgi:adenylosuccinate synthase
MLHNGPNIVLTKPDVLQGAKEFELVDGYELDGSSIEFTRDCSKLRRVQVRTRRFAGFNDDLSSLTDYDDAPSGIKEAVDYIEAFTGGIVRIMSTGADQSETIIIK